MFHKFPYYYYCVNIPRIYCSIQSDRLNVYSLAFIWGGMPNIFPAPVDLPPPSTSTCGFSSPITASLFSVNFSPPVSLSRQPMDFQPPTANIFQKLFSLADLLLVRGRILASQTADFSKKLFHFLYFFFKRKRKTCLNTLKFQ